MGRSGVRFRNIYSIWLASSQPSSRATDCESKKPSHHRGRNMPQDIVERRSDSATEGEAKLTRGCTRATCKAVECIAASRRASRSVHEIGCTNRILQKINAGAWQICWLYNSIDHAAVSLQGLREGRIHGHLPGLITPRPREASQVYKRDKSFCQILAIPNTHV